MVMVETNHQNQDNLMLDLLNLKKRNDQRFNKLEKKEVLNLSTRIDNLVKINNLKE